MAKNSLRSLRELNLILPDMEPALPCNWTERTFLKGIKDESLRTLTRNAFPAVGAGKTAPPQGTHPLFLLILIANFGFKFCPCTTREQDRRTTSYIPAGTRLLPAEWGNRTDKDSYILLEYSFNLPENTDVAGPKNFFGIVPTEAIQGSAYRRRLPG